MAENGTEAPTTSPSREEKRLARKFPDKNDINYSRLISSYLAGEVSKVGRVISSSSDSTIAATKYPYIPWNCKKEANYWRYLENIFNTGTSEAEGVVKRPRVKKARSRYSRRPPAKKITIKKAVKDIESEKSDSSSQGSEKKSAVNIPVRPITGITCDYISPALEWLIASTICASEAKKSKLRYKPDDELYPYYVNNDDDEFQSDFSHDEASKVKEISDLSVSSSRSDFHESLDTESESGQNLDISFTQTNISVTYSSSDRKNVHKRQDIKGEILPQALTRLVKVPNAIPSRLERQQDNVSPNKQQNSSPTHSSISSEREKKLSTKHQDKGKSSKHQGTPLVGTPLSGQREGKQATDEDSSVKEDGTASDRTPLSDERATDRDNSIKEQSNTLVHSPPLIDKVGKPSRMHHVTIKEQNSVPDLSSLSGDSKLESSSEEDPALAAEQLRIQNALRNRKYRVKRGLDAIPLMKRADIPGYLDVAVQRWVKQRQKRHKEFQRRKTQTVTKEDNEDGVHEARCERALEETTYALGRSLEQVKGPNRPDRIATLKRYFGLPQNNISPQVRKWRCSVIPRRRRPPSRCRSLPSEVSIVRVVQRKTSTKSREDTPNRSSSTSDLCAPKPSSESEVPKRCKTAPPQCNYVPQLFLRQPTWSHRYNFAKYQRASPQQSSARTYRSFPLHQP